jgi:thiol-disulfide isomerase/thioredoxin
MNLQELNHHKNGPILFSAEFCASCPFAVKAAEDKNIPVFKVDDHIVHVKTLFKVNTVPTLLIFKDGEEISRVSGAMEIKNYLNNEY